MKPKSDLKVRAGPAGIHFFGRESGLNILFDESVPPKETWAEAPRQVSIALTNACDLACAHCYAPKSRAILDFDKVTKWISELDAHGCFSIGLGGGEPTIYPQLSELCEYATRRTNLAVTMTTHAHRLNADLIKKLSERMNFIRISMDGIGSTYEAIRGRSFDDLIKKIRDVGKVLPFGINFVVNENTLGDLDAAVELVTELGAAEFLLLPEQAVGQSPGINLETLDLLRSWVGRYRGKIRLSISEASADGFPTCDPLEAETGLRAFAHIDASSVLKVSSFATCGVQISDNGVMDALHDLIEKNQDR